LAYEAAADVPGNAGVQQHLPGLAAASPPAYDGRGMRCTAARRAHRSGVGSAACGRRELEPDALTAPPAVLTIHSSKGSKRKDSRVDEEALIAWQDVLDMVVNGRPNEVACPYCNHRPLTIEEIEQSTRISCSKCGKFIQGRFTQ
jgi:ribosomal protein S27E